MYVCPHMLSLVLKEDGKGLDASVTEGIDGCEPPCGCLESKPGP